MIALRRALLRLADIVLVPAVYLAAHLLRQLRWLGIYKMPRCARVLLNVGVFPIRNHFYEPLFDPRLLRHSLELTRNLPGFDLNVKGQLELLDSFCYTEEIRASLLAGAEEQAFQFGNSLFEAGDAEFLYNLIRLKKPARIYEIGSGHSTLVAAKALSKNREEVPGYQCRHLCIEPFSAPWLEKAGVEVLRQRVETLDPALFAELESDDLLFIDSTHIIRPQGDVLFEYLEVLPSLQKGVIVHIHDIFTPRDYPTEWIVERVRFWNEQYLLEAFLTCNPQWQVIGALNYLYHHHWERLQAKCPFLTLLQKPGSFYITKVAG